MSLDGKISNFVTESYYEDDSGETYWGAQGAGVLPIARSTGKILINHRSAHVQEPNTYGVWGGAIDPGENPRRAAKRELKEEAGYRGNIELIRSHVYTSPGGDFKYHNFIGLVEEEFSPRLDWESQAFKWVTFDELLEMKPKLHFGLKELIDNDSRTILKHAESDRGTIQETPRNKTEKLQKRVKSMLNESSEGIWVEGDIWANQKLAPKVMRLVKERKEQIDRTCPSLGCMDKSHAWAEVFTDHDISGDVVGGVYIDKSPDGEYRDEIQHTWIELHRKSFWIFDPTAKQFRFPPRIRGYQEGTEFTRGPISEYHDWIDWI